jgi:hypothetical protein
VRALHVTRIDPQGRRAPQKKIIGPLNFGPFDQESGDLANSQSYRDFGRKAFNARNTEKVHADLPTREGRRSEVRNVAGRYRNGQELGRFRTGVRRLYAWLALSSIAISSGCDLGRRSSNFEEPNAF